MQPRNIIEVFTIPWVRIVLEAAAVVGVIWLLHQLSGVLTPVLVGLVLAYMLDPLVTWIARRGVPRRWAVGAVFGGGVLLILATLGVGVPMAWHEGARIYRIAFMGDEWRDQPTADGAPANGVWDPGEPLVRDLNRNGMGDPPQYLAARRFLAGKGIIQETAVVDPASPSAVDPDRWLDRWLKGQLAAYEGRDLMGWARALLGGIGFWILNLILVPIYGYFFSLNLRSVSATIAEHIPLKHRERTLRILSEIHASVGAFFRGRLAICGILGVISAIGFGIAGTPSFLILGLLMGLATAIPLASGVVLVPVAVLLYLQGAEPWQYWTAGITYVLIQGLEPVLIAAIMGKGVEMHPVLIVVAIFAFGTLLGGVGVVLAVPLAATARILGREFVYPQVRRLAGLDDLPATVATVAPLYRGPGPIP
jgi:predicted PurR-regulated permease PerM